MAPVACASSRVPVARLHRETGPCEMLAFDFLADNGAVQTSLFSNGTRVVANISDEDQDAGAYGPMRANSWLAFRDQEPASPRLRSP